jgi:cytoskeletal protein CcmA (bactofilin family)
MANRPTGEGSINTLVGSGTSIEGSLNVSSSIRVDGTIIGKITCSETLLVGKTGVVDASVRVKNATIGGKIQGDISAQEVVILEGKSTLIGDVTTKKLIIEEGAVFNGTCRMNEEAQTGSTRTQQPAPERAQERPQSEAGGQEIAARPEAGA